jgi:hypothetical protein
MNLGVTRVPKGVKSSGPRSDPSARSQQDEYSQSQGESDDDKGSQEKLELPVRYKSTDNLDECDELQQTEDAYAGIGLSA